MLSLGSRATKVGMGAPAPGSAVGPGAGPRVRSVAPSTASSTLSAIFRKPVSLPPATVTRPPRPTQTSSFREVAVALFPGSEMRGRTPAQAPTTASGLRAASV